jgi:5'-nucleotidase / UDP-sugar diphosphatase
MHRTSVVAASMPHRERSGFMRAVLITLVVSAMMAALLPSNTSAYADEHDFSDVPADNVHRENILRLSADGIIDGFDDGTFRPGTFVTRGQLAKIIAGLAGLDDGTAPYDFSDVAGTTHAASIQALADAGIVFGRADGTFGPGELIRRDQAASIMARFIEASGIGGDAFADVPEANVHVRNINVLAALEIILGTSADTYAPSAPLQRAQAASIAVRASDVFAEVDYTLSVLHINDGESALLPDEDAGFPGAARFVADLLALRADLDGNTDQSSVTISAGDNFLAGPRLNASLENPDAFYDALIYTQAEFDAITIGNHEFDFGPDVLADFIDAVPGIPFLSANLDVDDEPRLAALAADGRLAASETVVRDGRSIGIVGATYEGLESISSPRNARTGPVLAAVQAEVDALRGDGVETIILSSHLQNLDTELALVPQLTGVDAVVGGGGGEALGDDYPLVATDADGTLVPVVTVPGNYTDIGQLDLKLDADGNVLYPGVDSGLKPVALDGDSDAFIATNVEAPVAAFVADLATTVIGTSEVPLDGRRGDDGFGVRTRETNLGSLLADSMLFTAQNLAAEFGVPEADVALQNGGGIRNDGVIPAGNLTALDTFNVAAFTNIVSVAEIDGTTLAQALERSVSSLPDASGAHGQWGGVRFTYDTSQPAQTRDTDAGTVLTEGERIVDAVVTRADGTSVTLVDDGTVVAGSEMFTIASIDFLLGGQDGYVMFEAEDLTRLGVTYQQSLADYITDLGTVTAADYPDLTVDNDTYTRFGPVGTFNL